MKRLIDYFLLQWKEHPFRTPLLLRGARQVGKTHAARVLGKTYPSFVELNFDLKPQLKALFDKDLDPHRILHEIFVLTKQLVTPGQTLLFIDEIQEAPKAILALRYFYELIPELHVIAAGSLVDFAVQKVGMPVGRVSSLYMYPLSFMEFLAATQPHLIGIIFEQNIDQEASSLTHEKILESVGQYLAIGGMPEMVACWQKMHHLHACMHIPSKLIDTYKQDFNKYARAHQLEYLNLLFTQIPRQLGKKFKYSAIEADLRKRELEPCLDLLLTANIMHKVKHSGAHGIPLGAEVDFSVFKLLFIDVALTQYLLDLESGDWFINPLEAFINKGELVEAFVGQELIAYTHPRKREELYYWQREARDSSAEVDYVIQHKSQVIPIEVKGGKGSTLRSMHMFLESHPQSPYGIRFSTQNYSIHEKIHSYPLYAIAKVMADDDPDVKNALLALTL